MQNATDDQAPPHSATSWTIWLSLAAVAVVAAVASYFQALTVVQAADGHGTVTWFVAGLADPTLFAASVNIVDSLRRGQGWPTWSVVSVGVALLVTVGANIAAGSPHDVPSWLVRVWPPVAFALALESLMSFIRRNRAPAAGGHAAATAPQCPHGPASSADQAILTAYLHGRDCLGGTTFRAIASGFGTYHRKVAELVQAAESKPPAGASVPPPDQTAPAGPSLASANGHRNG